MNLYDFDKTIYKKDSPTQFYLYVLSRHPKLWWHFFVFVFWGVLLGLKVVTFEKFKEHFFTFVWHINYKTELKKFWDREIKNGRINTWYLKEKRDDDVICSATPRFMMDEIMPRLNKSATVFATELDLVTLKFMGHKNNRGEEKAVTLKNANYKSFENGYSDSTSDVPMLKMCKNKFRVLKDGKRVPFDEKYFN